MARIFHPFLIMLASCTAKELARQVQYLKEENRILRAKLPKRITVTPEERRSLLKFGKPLGKAIKELITIVTPGTFARWVRGDKKSDEPKQERKPGRPRTADEIRELVVKMASETRWGYTKIIGALRRLGIRNLTRQTVKNILNDALSRRKSASRDRKCAGYGGGHVSADEHSCASKIVRRDRPRGLLKHYKQRAHEAGADSNALAIPRIIRAPAERNQAFTRAGLSFFNKRASR